MIPRNLSLLATLIVGVVISSCTPYPENQPQPPRSKDPADANAALSPEEQQRLKEEREKAAEEARKKAEEQEQLGKTETGTGGGSTTGGETGSGGKTERKDYQFASPVPGKTGFVFSPYNNKVIDVRGIPSGMLVQDPTYPASEKKYFRVP
jgi:outer membrane biosynthesis protein TonB